MGGLPWHRGWDPFREFQHEVGRLLGTFEPLGVRVPRPFPAINLFDAGDRYILTAELPGMLPEAIDLSITGDTLTLRGERRRPAGISDDQYRRQERQFGRWARSMTFPDRVEGPGVAAQFAHGVLTVSLPKSEEARPRQIAVTTAG